MRSSGRLSGGERGALAEALLAVAGPSGPARVREVLRWLLESVHRRWVPAPGAVSPDLDALASFGEITRAVQQSGDTAPGQVTGQGVATTNGEMASVPRLYSDFFYLDTEERRRFSQMSHEYLIEQLQFTGDETASSKIKLNFNHPCKEIVWVEKEDDAAVGTYVTSYDTAKLQLNGHERFSARVPQYFQLVQPYQHHERVPTMSGKTCGINVYSFALKPEEHQPSGSCNMSRIDNATLNLSGVDTSNTVKVYAVNYNVLRVMSGMGGLAYSN